MTRSIYFAHPINTYGTDLEEALIQMIARRFHGRHIVNPGSPEHQAKFEAYMAAGAKEMDYFIDLIERECDELILLAFPPTAEVRPPGPSPNGGIGAGVYLEAAKAHGWAHPVWEIIPSGEIYTWAPNPSRMLTIDETRARIRMPDPSDPEGKRMITRPYLSVA